MNNTVTMSPSHMTAVQEALKPAYKGLHLVIRNNRPAAVSTPIASTHGLTLAPSRTSGAPQPADLLEARSAEGTRIKLAACFGAILTAPLVWCLHTLVLSFQTR